ncbi:long-chain fatty acid--CoA ligase [Actinomycetospora endophytica]|uniref:Long-chain fatty acid--CoA ligase n=1 Tax=Actinomycetospora endophytica TaxID=2291215 RepID=A0ABS8P498_9PSEU|nr:long-chain fatty acid--CoA ligase [Actinomycetospora endophytica]MCD2192772.1 long-chain fatty acid--CoA ligase [Actinomycetospora endophytica]
MDEGIGAWVARRAERSPDAVALVDGPTGARTSYAELDERVGARAGRLASLGVGHGDRVALLGENSTGYLEWLFAAARLGAIAVPINMRLAAAEVAYVLTDSGAGVLVRSTAFAPLADAGCALLTTPPQLVDVAGTPDGAVRREPEPTADRGAEPCVIMYTSGTTGRPKGAVLTHDNMLWNAINMLSAGPGIASTDVTIAAAPLFHIGALGLSALPLIYAGGTVVVVPSFDPAGFLDLMAAERVTTQFLVPAMWAALTRVPDLDDRAFPALRFAISGGAPCPVTVIERFLELGWIFTEGFGMTELSPCALFLDAADVVTHAGSVGRPFLHVDARLVDEAGDDVAVGEVGELVLRGPTVFAGYWNRPQETAEAMRGGWFHSGDLGTRDDRGFVTLVDRKKDMIITGGENVYPVEVEQVLHRHPGVADVAVVGVGDPQWGEAVLAVVVPADPAAPPPSDEVIAFARARIAHFKAPRRVEVVEELPRNATGKLLKRVLRERFAGSAAAVSR